MSDSKNTLKIVDVSSLDQKTADSILDGFATQGFLFVDGHNFTQEEVDHYFELSKKFFDLSIEEKSQYAIDSDDCGYTRYNQENLDPSIQKKGDPKEAFNFGLFNFVTGDFKKDKLPEMFKYGSENYEFIRKMALKMFELGTRILNLLAMGLQIDEDQGGANWFSDRHRPNGTSMTSMRMLHYPSTSKLDADQRIRAGAHTDYGSVTLLFQQRGEEGLELFDLNEQWTPVRHVESPNPEYIKQGKASPIVVNIADQLSYWTNGILKSTLHRVQLPVEGKDRYSIVFFFDAEDDVRLVPIPSKIVQAARKEDVDPNKKETDYITSRAYSEKRFKETYVSGH